MTNAGPHGLDSDEVEVEVEAVDDDDMLFRQVHPAFLDNGLPSSQAFKPTTKDSGRLSVRRSPMTAAEAYDDHVNHGCSSAGTWGVTVSEVRATGLRAIDDSKSQSAPPAHAYVDFRGLGTSQISRAAKVLLHYAVSRGRLHPAPDLR